MTYLLALLYFCCEVWQNTFFLYFVPNSPCSFPYLCHLYGNSDVLLENLFECNRTICYINKCQCRRTLSVKFGNTVVYYNFVIDVKRIQLAC